MIYAYLDIHTHMCVTYRYINIRTTIHTYIYILFFVHGRGKKQYFRSKIVFSVCLSTDFSVPVYGFQHTMIMLDRDQRP